MLPRMQAWWDASQMLARREIVQHYEPARVDPCQKPPGVTPDSLPASDPINADALPLQGACTGRFPSPIFFVLDPYQVLVGAGPRSFPPPIEAFGGMLEPSRAPAWPAGGNDGPGASPRRLLLEAMAHGVPSLSGNKAPLPRQAERPSLPPPENLQAAPLICRLPLKGGVIDGRGDHNWIPAFAGMTGRGRVPESLCWRPWRMGSHRCPATRPRRRVKPNGRLSPHRLGCALPTPPQAEGEAQYPIAQGLASVPGPGRWRREPFLHTSHQFPIGGRLQAPGVSNAISRLRSFPTPLRIGLR